MMISNLYEIHKEIRCQVFYQLLVFETCTLNHFIVLLSNKTGGFYRQIMPLISSEFKSFTKYSQTFTKVGVHVLQ